MVRSHRSVVKVTTAVRRLALCLPLVLAIGCVYIPGDIGHKAPPPIPDDIATYYGNKSSYTSVATEELSKEEGYTLRHITLQTPLGEAIVDYYQRDEKSDSLVLVFPVLGGSNMFEKHFSRHFAEAGLDTAIIIRNSDFKKPENFDRIEEVLRDGLVRDRMILDYFEKEHGKKKFGSFGISRGAINAAMLAGVDRRLEYNVLLMGASHIPQVLEDSDQPGLRKFRKKVMRLKNFSKEDFFAYLRQHVVTDPSRVAKYVDPEKTLLFLSFFDRTVPIRYGMRLRRELGRPETFFLPTGHYTSLLYTGFVKLLPPERNLSLFPVDFVESESTAFFRRKMTGEQSRLQDIPFYLAKFPFHVLGAGFDLMFSSQLHGENRNFLGGYTPSRKSRRESSYSPFP